MAKIQIDLTPGNTGAGLTPLNLARNGGVPTAEGVRALADTLNFLATRGQTIASHTSAIFEAPNFDTGENTDRAGWRWAFRTSKNARQIHAIYVVAPSATSGTTSQPHVYLALSEGLTGDTGVAPQTIVKSSGRRSTIAADDLFLRTQTFSVSGDTEYRLCLHLVNRAAVVSVTLVELPLNTADTAEHEIVNTALITGHAPILSTTMSELQTVVRRIWQKPKMLMNFSSEQGRLRGYAGGTSTTLCNAIDNAYTSASVNSPGTPVDLSRDGTQTTTDVPVVFAIHAARVSAAGGRFELRDQGNAVRAAIVVPTLLTEGGSAGADNMLSSWYSASGVLPTSTTKLDVFYRRDSGAGAITIQAAQVWRRHPVHPRDMTGLAAWYDASQITGVANGAALATWTDQSGNGYDLTMVGSPIYNSFTVGGSRPAVQFNGSSQYGRHLDPGGTAAYRTSTVTVMGVWRADSSAPAADGAVCGYAHSLVAGGYRWRFGLKTTSRFTMGQNNVETASTYAPPTTGGLTAFTPYSYQTDNRRLGVHTNFVATETIGGAITYPNNTGLYVGASNGFAPDYWDGDIAEVLIFNRALSLSERHDVEHYLAAKWGLSTATLT